MTERLSAKTLEHLPSAVARPNYTPSEHAAGIVHIGIGAFHRGHQAVFTDDALALKGGDWRITGVSLRSPTVSEQMTPQDCLYTVTAKSEQGIEQRLIGSVAEVLVGPESPEQVISRLAASSTKLVTLTVTEKGYYYDSANGKLNIDNADIQHDLANPLAPRTMPGYIVAACEQRMKHAAGKLTIISCDNLPDNGEITRTAVLTLAESYQPELASWISANVGFCSSMVDRIVPAMSDEIRDEISRDLGVDDQALIVTEPFKQWVIEDKFVTDRPAWDTAGVLIVNDVSVYEKLKLRTLNGSHSALAYAGCLCGYEYIHEAMTDTQLVHLVTRMMQEEMEATLSIPDGFDISAYQQEVRDRFANSHIRYGTKQVATDGSQKVMQRLLKPAMELIEQGKPFPCITSVLACWLKFLGGQNEQGEQHTIADPLADTLSKIANEHLASPKSMVEAMFAQTSIFPETLKRDDAFKQDLIEALSTINENGVKGQLKKIGIQ